MNVSINLFLSLLFISIQAPSLRAEDNPFRRTDVYLQGGFGEYAALSVNAEHYFIQLKQVHLGLRTGLGSYSSYSGLGGIEAPLAVTGLWGKNHHFIEGQAGVLFRYEDAKVPMGEHTMAAPAFATLGYTFRYHHLLLKANVSTTLTVNAGVGFIF